MIGIFKSSSIFINHQLVPLTLNPAVQSLGTINTQESPARAKLSQASDQLAYWVMQAQKLPKLHVHASRLCM